MRELSNTLTYTIPALALIWYLILEKKSLPGFIQLMPERRDLRPFFIGFPALTLIGLVLSLVMTNFSVLMPPRVEAPAGVIGWIIMLFSCGATGYLEESFFRFYLLKKMEEWSYLLWLRILLSVLLFAFCHLYEGPWGILNSALAGLLLAVLFERYRSFHGIAWAHGAYNAFVYFMGIFS